MEQKQYLEASASCGDLSGPGPCQHCFIFSAAGTVEFSHAPFSDEETEAGQEGLTAPEAGGEDVDAETGTPKAEDRAASALVVLVKNTK